MGRHGPRVAPVLLAFVGVAAAAYVVARPNAPTGGPEARAVVTTRVVARRTRTSRSRPHGTLPPLRRAAAPDDTGWHATSSPPIDPRQQTSLAFCERSYWLQPWRGYLDTPRVSALRDAAGLTVNVAGPEAASVLELMGRTGFTRARAEFGWDSMRADDPTQLRDRGGILAALRAARQHGVRPLLLLNANDGMPGPGTRTTLELALPAVQGSRQVFLTPDSAGRVVPGLTGLDDSGIAAESFISAVGPGGRATLSRPLPRALASGPQPATTLRFRPFGEPYLPGTHTFTPAFRATLDGWLAYVGALTGVAREALGDDAFDVEVWNELSFGSNFLDAGNYYDPLPPELAGEGDAKEAILAETVRYLRDPAHGVPGVGIGDGFANQTPFPSGATSPAGLTALDKHPYSGARTEFGADQPAQACRPVDALGHPEGREVAPNRFVDGFTPSFTSYFPEYYLSAIQTEHLIRDVSPLTTDISGVDHGRATRPATGRAPALWVTETNMDPALVRGGLPGPVARHMQAKSALRTLVSFVNKGIQRVDFYAAAGERYGVVDPEFLAAAREGRTEPGLAGETIGAVGRMFDHLGSDRVHRRRRLSLLAVADRSDRVQFAGDGTDAHPPLFDRDVLGVFPFQVGDHRFIVPAYVMTRDVAHVYDEQANASDPARYDLPAEPYRLRLGGVGGLRARVAAFDPLTGSSVPARIVGRSRRSVTVELPLTDSPRMLRITD